MSQRASLFVDKDNVLWIGTDQEGIFLFDGTSFTQLTTQSGLPSNKIYQIYQTRSKVIWITTDKGLCTYEDKVLKQIPDNEGFLEKGAKGVT